MEVVYPICCGLDVHKKSVVACVLRPGPAGRPLRELRTFGTMTSDLLALSDWLTTLDVAHVAMESTGVYWKPLYNLLEGTCHVVVVNAQHIKQVPGRKTDVKDAEWIATLLRHGLLRPSFIPDRDQRELRELTRYRTSLVRERAAESNRLQKTLEGANIKLAAVVSDILGVSGRQMLAGLVAGTPDAADLAALAHGRMRDKVPQLEQALVGQFGAHQRFLVARQLAHIEYLEGVILELDAEVSQRLGHMPEPEGGAPPPPTTGGTGSDSGGAEHEQSAGSATAAIARLDTIPGVGRRTAEVLVAELGLDMGRFPTARHLASWAGMCPGQRQSAGKRGSGKTRKGSPWLRSALVEAAQAAARTKDTYLSAQYHRIAARRGRKRAAVAVGHTILIIAYHVLQRQTTYHDLGGSYFDERNRQQVQRRAVKKLEGLGFTVRLEAPMAA